MELKKKLFLIISTGFILYIVFPLVADLLPIPIATISLTVTVALFLLYPAAILKNKIFLWFLLYAVVLYLFLALGKSLTIGVGMVHDAKKIIIEFAFILPSLVIFSILQHFNDYQLYKKIGRVSLIIILLSFIYYIPIIIDDPGLLRDAMYYEKEELPVKGLPNYTLLHAYIIAFPAQLYGISKFDGWKKRGMIAIAVLFMYIIINTSITTSLIIGLGLVVFALLYSPKKKMASLMKVALFFCFIYALYLLGAFVSILDWAIDFFEGTATQMKMMDFKDILQGGSSENAATIEGRVNYHDMSIRAFLVNPFTGSAPVGGHSNFLDRLGGLGLLGFIPYLMLFYTQFRAYLKQITDSTQRIYYFVGFFATLVFAYNKGLFGQEGWLFMLIILPSMLLWYKGDKKIHRKELIEIK